MEGPSHDTSPAALIPLRMDHAYLRGAPNSAYWSIAPYLIQQSTECSCSLATAVMLINAVRGHQGHPRISEPASEDGLLARLDDPAWKTAVAQDGAGLGLTEFAAAMERALASYECAADWSVAIAPVTSVEAGAADLRAALLSMESGDTAFVAANFHLDLFYGDGVDVGHFSPIGAYDPARDLILMLDVYKQGYEPMWAPLAHLARAMATRSNTGEQRGYAVVKRRT
ncbi:MAG TPA: phytochelatin synthase family protein [Kofleriaceae bacterium]|nr:phytochelatin synthase family protein [Kofleriaceae bacterium]